MYIREAGQGDQQITELDRTVTITIKLPDSIKGYSDYQIARFEGGNYETIHVVYDEENGTLTFEIDRFATYAILYSAGPGPVTGFTWWLLFIPVAVVLIGGFFFFILLKRKKDKKDEEVELNNTDTSIKKE